MYYKNERYINTLTFYLYFLCCIVLSATLKFIDYNVAMTFILIIIIIICELFDVE